jgi:hypothetical protein
VQDNQHAVVRAELRERAFQVLLDGVSHDLGFCTRLPSCCSRSARNPRLSPRYANSSFVEWLHDFDSANVRLGQKERAVAESNKRVPTGTDMRSTNLR